MSMASCLTRHCAQRIHAYFYCSISLLTPYMLCLDAHGTRRYARGQIESEERHSLELNKMMRDYDEDEVVMTTPAHVVASAAAASSLTSKL